MSLRRVITDPAKAGSLWPAMLPFVSVGLVGSIDTGMMFAAMATFIEHFHDPVRVSWLITATLLIAAASAATGGRIGDLYGRRRVLLAVLAVVAVGSLISAASVELHWMLVGRTLQGAIGAALPLCYGLVTETVPTKRLPAAISMLTASTSLGAGLGAVFGGLIVDHLPWQWLFLFLSMGAATAAALVFFLVPPSPAPPRSKHGIDVVGGVLFVPAIVGLLVALTQGGRWGWSAWPTLSLLVGSLLVLWLWGQHELRHPAPLIDVRQFGRREVALGNAIIALLAAGPYQTQVQMLLMQQPTWTGVGLGVSATVAGLLRMPTSLFGSVGATWSGRLVGVHGVRYAVLAGLVVMSLGWGALTLAHDSVLLVALAMLFGTFGVTTALVATQNLIIHAAPSGRTSETTGLTSVIRYASQAFGAQLLALALASSVVSDPAHGPGSFPDGSAYRLTLGLITLFCLLCFPLALSISRDQRLARVERDGEGLVDGAD